MVYHRNYFLDAEGQVGDVHLENMKHKIVYIDMDNVLVDFRSAFEKIEPQILQQYENEKDEIPGIFSLMQPMMEGVKSYEKIAAQYDTYILSTAPWKNPTAWSDKLLWVQKHLGEVAHKRLILTHNKHLNRGDYLIDDRPNNGASEFQGELILFGSISFPDWKSVVSYLGA
jgi:5'-nucleotidase